MGAFFRKRDQLPENDCPCVGREVSRGNFIDFAAEYAIRVCLVTGIVNKGFILLYLQVTR